MGCSCAPAHPRTEAVMMELDDRALPHESFEELRFSVLLNDSRQPASRNVLGKNLTGPHHPGIRTETLAINAPSREDGSHVSETNCESTEHCLRYGAHCAWTFSPAIDRRPRTQTPASVLRHSCPYTIHPTHRYRPPDAIRALDHDDRYNRRATPGLRGRCQCS